jgi:hypothetical protein
MHRKIFAIATAVMLGIATMSGAALARGGGGGGGHGGGGFGGGHIGGGFGGAHIGGGFGGHAMGLAGVHGFARGRGFHDRGLGHGHVAHEFRDHRFRGLYGWWPYNDCTWPYRYDYNNCYAYGG